MRTRLWILAAFAVSSLACMGTVRLQQTLAPTVGDLAAIKSIEVTGESGEVLLQGTVTEAKSAGREVERTATLTSPKATEGGANGTIQIEIDRSGRISDEEVTVTLRGLPYPALCRLVADGHELALFSTTEKGEIDLRLNRRVTSKDGR